MRLLKIIIAGVFTVCAVFGFLYYFGETTYESALEFTFVGATSKPQVQTEPMPNFEENFLAFTGSFEKDEESSATVTTQTQNDGEAVAVNLSALSGKYKNYNGTALINDTDYSVSDIMNEKYDKPSAATDKPYILLYHTHTSESYSDGGSVVDIGAAMKEEFERLGYKTLHIKESFDKEQFSGAYSRSRTAVEKVLQDNPSVKLVFDIHRDSITTADGTVYRPVTNVDGKSCAQVMFVCGTDSKGLSHPNWRENFKFALGVSRIMGNKYGDLSRPVNLRSDRFNTHFTNHSFLMEIGSNANTLEEAKTAAILTAQSVIAAIE